LKGVVTVEARGDNLSSSLPGKLIRGPRYSSVDFTIAKAFGLPSAKVIGENAKLEIRANFFNPFNQVNLGPLGNQNIGNILLTTTGQTVSGNGTFDQAQFALAGRVTEGQARFSF
jgi:hypothetical protein